MTERERAFTAMKNGSVDGILDGATVYGVEIDTMNAEELKILAGWFASQLARLNPEIIGVNES